MDCTLPQPGLPPYPTTAGIALPGCTTRGAARFASVHQASEHLLGTFERMATDRTERAAETYVAEVRAYASGRSEVLRSQLLATLFRLVAVVGRRYVFGAGTAATLVGEESARLEAAVTTEQMVARFSDAVERLGQLTNTALAGSRDTRIQAVCRHLHAHYTEPLKLDPVARQAGYSVPAFVRAFKHVTGTSFKAYVRSLRLDHATRLLRESSLPVGQVALASGFSSPHHLIRSMKTVTGLTPGEYRRDCPTI